MPVFSQATFDQSRDSFVIFNYQNIHKGYPINKLCSLMLVEDENWVNGDIGVIEAKVAHESTSIRK